MTEQISKNPTEVPVVQVDDVAQPETKKVPTWAIVTFFVGVVVILLSLVGVVLYSFMNDGKQEEEVLVSTNGQNVTNLIITIDSLFSSVENDELQDFTDEEFAIDEDEMNLDSAVDDMDVLLDELDSLEDDLADFDDSDFAL